jgi:hypothetical protein
MYIFKSFLVALIFLATILPKPLFADENMAILESVVASKDRVQPSLQHYLAIIETSRVEELMTRRAREMSVSIIPSPAPVIIKFWQRHGNRLILFQPPQLDFYMETVVRELKPVLALELDNVLLPADLAEKRLELTNGAEIKLSEVALADNNLISRLEITFEKPIDLGEAFYAVGMHLPQNHVVSLVFDIDTKNKTVNELLITTNDGLQLTVEIRYIDAEGGQIPERFQITSPDGKIDERFEVTFSEVDGFLLPARMKSVIHRPELQETLEVLFKDYQVNQPISEDIQTLVNAQLQEK